MATVAMSDVPVRRRSLDRRYALLGLALIAPTVLTFCAVIVYPLISAIYLSLFSIFTPTLDGSWVGLDNYAEVLAGGKFWNALLNTLIWTVGTLVLQISDTGPGLENGDNGQKSCGVGLRNTRERLQQLYGDAQAFTLGPNEPTGLTVTINIPFEEDRA